MTWKDNKPNSVTTKAIFFGSFSICIENVAQICNFSRDVMFHQPCSCYDECQKNFCLDKGPLTYQR